MTKGRLEAFSDGVIAILITIMVIVPVDAEINERQHIGKKHRHHRY